MAANLPPADRSALLRLIGSDLGPLPMEEVGLFLTDLSLLHDLFRLARDPRYARHAVSRFTLYRHRRPIPPNERLLIARLSKASPLEAVAVIREIGKATSSIALDLVTALEKIYNLRASRKTIDLGNRRLELENERLELENLRLRNSVDPEPTSDELPVTRDLELASNDRASRSDRNMVRSVDDLIVQVADRLDRSPIRIRVIEIDLPEPDRKA